MASDVDDLLADVYVIAWRRIDGLPDAPLPWLYKVAGNILANHNRARNRRQRLSLRRAAEREPADDFAVQDELLAAIAQLRPSDREVLRLWAWEQLEPADLSSVLDCSVSAAQQRLSRARRRLRDVLSAEGGLPDMEEHGR
jgi:RNA polymerase sigma-70 factor (ECF subfamily)